MIKIEVNSETKNIDFSFDGDTESISAELTLVLTIWKKILKRDLDKEEAQKMYSKIIFGYTGHDIDAIAEDIMKHMEITVTES